MEALLRNESFTTVAVVHCETSTGIINPVEDVARLVASLQPGTVWTPFALPLSLLACVCHEFAFYIFHPLQALFTLPFVTSFETNNLILLPNHFFFNIHVCFFHNIFLFKPADCWSLQSISLKHYGIYLRLFPSQERLWWWTPWAVSAQCPWTLADQVSITWSLLPTSAWRASPAFPLPSAGPSICSLAKVRVVFLFFISFFLEFRLQNPRFWWIYFVSLFHFIRCSCGLASKCLHSRLMLVVSCSLWSQTTNY